jgi:hypothetical protein
MLISGVEDVEVLATAPAHPLTPIASPAASRAATAAVAAAGPSRAHLEKAC